MKKERNFTENGLIPWFSYNYPILVFSGLFYYNYFILGFGIYPGF